MAYYYLKNNKKPAAHFQLSGNSNYTEQIKVNLTVNKNNMNQKDNGNITSLTPLHTSVQYQTRTLALYSFAFILVNAVNIELNLNLTANKQLTSLCVNALLTTNTIITRYCIT